MTDPPTAPAHKPSPGRAGPSSRSHAGRADAVILAVIALFSLGGGLSTWAERVELERWVAVIQPIPSNRLPPSASWPEPIHRFGGTLSYRYLPPIQGGLAVATIGLLGWAIGPRRSGRGRPGPGVIALVIATFVVLTGVGRYVEDLAMPPILGWRPPTSMPTQIWSWIARFGTRPNAPIIAAAWVTLAVTGGWRRLDRRGERLGRWVGGAWIALGVVIWGCEMMQAL